MEEKRNVPKLRFPGFTDSWEQRRLGELMDITSVKRVHQDDWSSEGIRFLRARDLVAFSNGEEIDEPLFISEELYEEYSSLSGKAVENDLLVTGVGTIGVPWRVPSSEPIYFKDGNIIWFKNMNVIDGLFFYYSFTSSSIQDFIRKSAGSGTVGTFTIDTGKKTPIQLPSIDEQAQIGGFFQRLDSLIALHQRELDHVKELKKGLLQKMFPKEGTNVPELRFPGFTDPWEQRRLGEVAHRVTRKNEEGMSDLPLTISAQHGLVDQRDFFNSQVASRDMRGYYLLERGEFAYNKSTSSDSPWGAIKRLTEYEKGCLSTLYICFGLDEGDPDFLVTYYETSRWHRGIRMIAAEGARNHGLLNIAPGDFFETELTLPGKIEEQTAIGALFAKLDSLIALHQRE
ncbi:type I restriction enzyme, S subunit, partial [Adlercreutzia equolifaciens subsp. celatus DSM 18785]|nr:type I restriction enzyme, S subunit [Adlercreutzia equolifaciens subsp. celatus DSM 18785]